jgi:hypothetical protein
VATFSEDMDSSTINGSTTFTLTKQGANEPLAAQVSYDSATKKATLHPDAELESGTTYTAMLKGGATGVKDLAGNPLAKNKTWFFSTLAVPLAPSETSPPETTIDSGPADGATLSSGDVSFTFSSSEPNSVFECSADGGAYAACTSPKALSKLSNGQHSFAARATDVAGNTDATPATRSFTVSVPTRVNVLDYGATPNDSINDSAAFEDAMDAAGPGEVVYVPPASGAYRLFNIHPPSDTTLQVDSGATLKKFGSTQGPLFKVLGPDDNTFVTNVHFEGVSGGDFTIDIADAGQETGAIVFQNVKGFSVKHFRCVQNNSNQLQEAPSSRRPCLSFIASNTTQRADGTYNQPTDGTIEDAHAIDSPYGWGLVQTTGAANVTFSDISGNGGAVLRLENFSNGWTPMKNLTADGVTCTDGHDAVHMNPHGVTHLGSIHVTNVVADSCESAVSEAGDGTYGPNVTIDGVTVIPGNTAQDRDPAKDLTYVGAWLIGPSVYCINDRTSAYNVNVSNVNCGLPNT